jgi:HSP90 family molecular chaperone
MTNLTKFNNRKIISAESNIDDLSVNNNKDKDNNNNKDKGSKEGDIVTLSDKDVNLLGDWMVNSLPKKLSKVKSTKRLSESPAIITDHESGSLRRMMRMIRETRERERER